MHLVGDFVGAGTETTSNTIIWLIVYMLNFPDVMSHVQAEIYDVIGRHREPSMKDKVNLPYCEAVILEVQRCAEIAPLGVPHSTMKVL